MHCWLPATQRSISHNPCSQTKLKAFDDESPHIRTTYRAKKRSSETEKIQLQNTIIVIGVRAGVGGTKQASGRLAMLPSLTRWLSHRCLLCRDSLTIHLSFVQVSICVYVSQ